MYGEDGRAFLEDARRAVDGTFALGIENQHLSISETKRSSAHGRNQIRIRIDHNDVERACQPAHESLAKNLARTHGEKPLEQIRWQCARQNKRVEVTLMV